MVDEYIEIASTRLQYNIIATARHVALGHSDDPRAFLLDLDTSQTGEGCFYESSSFILAMQRLSKCLHNPVHFTFSRSPVLREFLGHARGLIDAAEPSATVKTGVQQRLKAMRLYGTLRADGQSAHHTLAGIGNAIISIRTSVGA